jgi:hypothetical protein
VSRTGRANETTLRAILFRRIEEKEDLVGKATVKAQRICLQAFKMAGAGRQDSVKYHCSGRRGVPPRRPFLTIFEGGVR